MNHPRGVRRIDVYSPKLTRRLQGFGEAVYRQWIRLEADPSVQTYCERPGYLDLEDERILADLWVTQKDRESLLIVGDNNYVSRAFIGPSEYQVRSVPHAELSAAQIWIENWERILPVVIARRDLVPASLLHCVQHFVADPTPLTQIERECSTSDPTTVRAAAFTLLHRGRLGAPQLWTPLSFLTQFESVDDKP